ncbi:hypothetical protein SRHO_G00314540 [Serrasalmus rhombeus]
MEPPACPVTFLLSRELHLHASGCVFKYGHDVYKLCEPLSKLGGYLVLEVLPVPFLCNPCFIAIMDSETPRFPLHIV